MGIIFISSHFSALSLTFLAIVQGCYRKPTRLILSIPESPICHELFFCRTFGLCWSKAATSWLIGSFSNFCTRNWRSDLRKEQELSISISCFNYTFCFFCGTPARTSMVYGQSLHGFPHSSNYCSSTIVAFEGRKWTIAFNSQYVSCPFFLK